MLSRKRLITIVLSLITLITNKVSFADWKEGANAVDVSGGEHHTLVVTADSAAWACGNNSYYQLGTGNTQHKWTLIRVDDGDMGTSSGDLENIDDIDAGWKHSLALDISGHVWAWGYDDWGQLGNGEAGTSSTPVLVHGVDDVGYLGNITCISAGRSGEHSLAVDSSDLVYAWGRNQEGQLGNDLNGPGCENGYRRICPPQSQ